MNLDLPVSVSSPFVWLAAAVVLAVVAVLVVRGYRRRRAGTDRGRQEAPALLMPDPHPDLPGRFSRLLGEGDPTASPRGRVAAILGFGLAIVAIVLVFRSVDPAATGPVYVQTAVPQRSGSPAGQAERREITGSQVAVDTTVGTRLVLWAGDDQRGEPGRRLPRLLSVVVTDSQQSPIAGAGVRFEVAPGGGSLEAASVETSDAGLAMTSWRLGQDPEAWTVVAMLADNPAVSVRFTARLVEDPLLTGPADPSAGPSSAPPASNGSDSASSGGEPEPATPSGPGEAEPVNDNLVSPGRAGRWAVGGVHSCLVNGAGGITCWGATTRPVGNRAMETLISGVAAGVFHVCGIGGGSAIGCWAVGGADRQGLEGEWSLPEGAGPAEVAVGSAHICARSSGRRVYCWGANDRGQLGSENGDQEDPTLVPAIRNAVRLTSGWFHSCALTVSGQAYCWGANGAGQLGQGSTDDSDRPAAVDQPAPFVDLVAGSVHTCALDAGGRVWCWGDNQHGQLGNPAITSTRRPTPVDTDLRFASLAAGGAHTCGLTGAGTAWCWGRNVFGQLGDGGTDDARIPVPVSGNLAFARLGAGGAHTCGEAENGRLYCWGNNIQGQLGDGTRDNHNVPVRASGGDAP